MITGYAGRDVTLSPGEDHDFEQGEAIRLISAGYAFPVSEEKIERAVSVPVAEKRVKAKK